MIQGLVTGYWHKGGLELYRYAQGKPVRIAGGPLEKLAPVRGALQRIVLVVGRDRLLHVRKRYPPASKEKLISAVNLELGELFPFTRPDYYCRVSQSIAAYTELDIWAWESETYDLLRKILPFHYVIPEEAAFFSSAAETVVWTYGGVTHLLTVAGSRFLSAASHPADAVMEEDIGRFLNSLDPYGLEVRKIRVYGVLPFALQQSPVLEVVSEADRGYPPCLDGIPALNLREFRVHGETYFPSYQGLLLRIVIYCILGYGLMLHLTVRNYEHSTQELRQMSRQMDKQILVKAPSTGSQADDYSGTLKELKEKLKARPSPARVLDMLARTLPENSFLSTVILNENNLEVLVMSKEPLAVLKTLAGQKEIRNIRLKGPLNMEQKTGQYSFTVAIEIAG